jgi:hypothetical protein
VNELLWLIAVALGVGAGVTVLDVDFRLGGWRAGRPVYGVLVLGGLLLLYARVVAEGTIPVPGWAILAFAVFYVPFLSGKFIDLELTDAVARTELENLLLERDYSKLRHASGTDVLTVSGRKLRMHWECSVEEHGLFLELDVHPSLLPVTVSRPHLAQIRGPAHLELLRREILRRRERPDGEPIG